MGAMDHNVTESPQERLRSLEFSLSKLSSEAQRLRYRNNALEKKLTAKLQSAESINQELSAKLQSVEKKYRELTENLQSAKARILLLENSTSWLLTAPFRSLARFLRNSRASWLAR